MPRGQPRQPFQTIALFFRHVVFTHLFLFGAIVVSVLRRLSGHFCSWVHSFSVHRVSVSHKLQELSNLVFVTIYPAQCAWGGSPKTAKIQSQAAYLLDPP